MLPSAWLRCLGGVQVTPGPPRCPPPPLGRVRSGSVLKAEQRVRAPTLTLTLSCLGPILEPEKADDPPHVHPREHLGTSWERALADSIQEGAQLQSGSRDVGKLLDKTKLKLKQTEPLLREKA